MVMGEGGNETVLGKFDCALSDKILLQGKLYLTGRALYFHSAFNSGTLFGGKGTQKCVPYAAILNVSKQKTLKIFPNAIKIVLTGD